MTGSESKKPGRLNGIPPDMLHLAISAVVATQKAALADVFHIVIECYHRGQPVKTDADLQILVAFEAALRALIMERIRPKGKPYRTALEEVNDG